MRRGRTAGLDAFVADLMDSFERAEDWAVPVTAVVWTDQAGGQQLMALIEHQSWVLVDRETHEPLGPSGEVHDLLEGLHQSVHPLWWRPADIGWVCQLHGLLLTTPWEVTRRILPGGVEETWTCRGRTDYGADGPPQSVREEQRKERAAR